MGWGGGMEMVSLWCHPGGHSVVLALPEGAGLLTRYRVHRCHHPSTSQSFSFCVRITICVRPHLSIDLRDV